MGLTTVTALEIFNNPGDLRFRVYRCGGNWAFAIDRKVKAGFIILVRSKPIFDTDTKAIEAIEKLLKKISSKIALHPDAPSDPMLSEEHWKEVIGRLQKKGRYY